MLTLAAWIRDLLVPILIVGFVAHIALLLVLIAQRLVHAALEAARKSAARRYQPYIDAVLADDPAPDALARLRAVPRRHRRTVARLLLAPLSMLTGDIPNRACRAAAETRLLADWHRDLRDPAWWVRAEAAIALGLVRDETSVASLVASLDDDHQQVRAAVVDSLGRIGDPTVAPALLVRLTEQSRHERARIVEALRRLGSAATAPLLDYAASHPENRAVAAEILGYVAGPQAHASLLEWTSDERPAVRAAAWQALARIGVDNRAYYYALSALHDGTALVRAAASMALGRTGRNDAAAYLADRLDDEWEVAAQAARALARIGPEGLARLHTRIDGAEGHGRQLARQVAWEASRR